MAALCDQFLLFHGAALLFAEDYARTGHVITFIVLLFTGVIIGTQTARLRMQAISARRREKNTSTLFGMSRELTANRGRITLAQIAAQHMAEVLDSDVFLWLPDAKGQLQTVVAETETENQKHRPGTRGKRR